MVGLARAAPTLVPSADPADDWSGVEPEAVVARRRAEIWPQLEATLLRGLFIFWGVLLAILLLLEIYTGWALVFVNHPGLETTWGLAVALSTGGAWLAFEISGQMDVELEDDFGIAPA